MSTINHSGYGYSNVIRMKVVMDKVKAPLAHQYYLEWLKQAVSEFGANSFPIPFIGSFCQVSYNVLHVRL